MPVVPTYPGVYVEEIPSGVRTVVGVSTSVAAFVDWFRRGPMNRAVQIFSMGDFEREFGGLDTNSEASYSIQQFFLNGGSEAWVVRVGTAAAVASQVRIGTAVVAPESAGGATMALTVSAISPGAWGDNIGVRIDSAAPTGSPFTLTITEYQTVGTRRVVLRQEVFRNLTPATAAAIVNDANTGSRIVNVTVNGTNVPHASGTFSGRFTTDSATLPSNPTLTVRLTNAATNTDATVPLRFPNGTNFANPIPLRTIVPVLQAAIRSAFPDNPVFSEATVELTADNRLRVLAGTGSPFNKLSFVSGGAANAGTALLLIGGADAAAVVINTQEYMLGQNGLGTNAAPGVIGNSAQLGGTQGADGSFANAASADIATALIGSEAAKEGIYALEDVDLFNLLAIPRASIVGTGNGLLTGTAARSIMAVAIPYCQRRRAFFLMDTPVGVDDPLEIRNWMRDNDALRSSYAALYYPRVQIPDPLNEFRLRSVGASGTVAGLYARIDTARGVWKAPAGTEAALRNVAALDDVLTDAENGSLNPLAINALRTFPVYGTVSWGARTLDGSDVAASEWKYVPVRRLALYIEESLFRGLKWVVFEPNDESLWAQIRLNVGAFMQNLFRQGAFQGRSPREAYFVRCDSETTTQNDINLGVVNIVVGFAPLKPAEFVILRLQQIAGQINV